MQIPRGVSLRSSIGLLLVLLRALAVSRGRVLCASIISSCNRASRLTYDIGLFKLGSERKRAAILSKYLVKK